MSFGLFPRSGLQQDTGLLKERWNQEGSTLSSNASILNTPDNTVFHTVTAGKVYYLKNLIATCRNNDSNIYDLDVDDNTTLKLTYKQVGNSTQNTLFAVPIKFETTVKIEAVTGDWTITIIGWEEDG